MSYQLRDKALATYKKAVVKYHNPKDRTVYTSEVENVENGTGEQFNDTTAADTLEIRTKAEDKAQAEAKAKVALYRSRSNQVEGSLTLQGDPFLVAGNNFELTNMGSLSGRYHICESTHSIARGGGYTTSLSVKRVGYVVKEKQKSGKKRKPPKYTVSVIQ
jgi:phage protein D